MSVRRGEVWWWKCPNHGRDFIQEGNRPVVIVSNDACNESSAIVTVVPFTGQAKRPYPSRVAVILPTGMSVALAEQITTIPVSELGDCICTLHNFQLDQIDTAIALQLGFISPQDRPFAPFNP